MFTMFLEFIATLYTIKLLLEGFFLLAVVFAVCYLVLDNTVLVTIQEVLDQKKNKGS